MGSTDFAMRRLWKRLFGARAPGPVEFFPCPLCGEPVREGALACRACGSDATTGWAPQADGLSVDVGPAGEDFDYEGWLRREVEGIGQPTWKTRWWNKRTGGLLVVILLALAFVLGGFGRG